MKTESSQEKSTPGFAEGNSILQSYGLSLSGKKERILSPFKADKFFHFVNQSYERLVSSKPGLPNRFSLAEFRHASALQLQQRLENVKFDALGIKPAAPTRVPLPKNLRVFQPIWSVLANIGTVDDEELGSVYIPDCVYPTSEDMQSTEDIENIVSCTLWDWKSSWREVLLSRSQRTSFQEREGHEGDQRSNESLLTKSELMEKIKVGRARALSTQSDIDAGKAKIIDGSLYRYPVINSDSKKDLPPGHSTKQINGSMYEIIPDAELKKQKAFYAPQDYDAQVEKLFEQARQLKKEKTTPQFDVTYKIESYKISDGTIETDPGAYGAWLHWDPQLWIDYENFVDEVSSLAMFSLSMPVETSGSYAWILPVEKREDNDATVFARLPKKSIPTSTWILSLLLQSSTLPFSKRSTWTIESDGLSNVLGLRQRYINAAVKTAAPVTQYGTI